MYFQCSHPTLGKFIGKLRFKEDLRIHRKISRVNDVESISKKKRYQHLDKRLFNLVLNCHRNIVDYLSALAHNITLY